jgi:DNA-binding CsgD family transcriptional regulator
MARLLAAAEELALLGSWELDLRSGERLWSEGLFRILGVSDRAPETMTEMLAYVHPDDRGRIGLVMADVAERPETVPETGLELALRLVRADGAVRDVRAVGRIEHDEQGPARWLGALQDVTEQRLTERELHAHHAVSQALLEWQSFDLGVVDLLRRIATALDFPMGALWLWDEQAEGLACRAFWTAPNIDPGDWEAVVRSVRFADGEGSPGLAWQTREPVVTPDVATDAAFVLRDAARARGMASAISFPAVGPDGPVAVLTFYSFERREPSGELVRTLTAIGRELGSFLSRRRAELSPTPLSEREMEVLRLAASGLSGPRIAEQLVLSPATVKTHLEHIYEKLGVGDRTAAVAHALRTGLIS